VVKKTSLTFVFLLFFSGNAMFVFTQKYAGKKTAILLKTYVFQIWWEGGKVNVLSHFYFGILKQGEH